MTLPSAPSSTAAPAARFASPWRWLLPVVLVLFFLAVLIWLPWQARQMERTERQEQLIADTLWVEQTIRFQLGRHEEALRSLAADIATGRIAHDQLQAHMARLLRNGRELQRVQWIDQHGEMQAGSDGASPPALDAQARDAADHARRARRGVYSQRPPDAGGGAAIVYYTPLLRNEQYLGTLVATFDAAAILEEMVPWWFAQENQISLLDRDDKVLARRMAAGPGHGIYTHKRALDLPGAVITLMTDSVKSEPKLLPNLLVGSVIALSLGLLWSLIALWIHISRRLQAEGALRQQMLFRTAMENSLVTGLRARDMDGLITYVNPAFCQIVGHPAEELVGRKPPMPYWAPEAIGEYQDRFAAILAGNVEPQVETVFVRPDGTRVPVLIFEAPLVDSDGRQTGWMGSILDISDRKRIEELNRQQEEKLQTSARLATMGELASMLAHELNQPLAAISSYTTGALNMMARADSKGEALDCKVLKPALEQAGAQAQRAGQIIRSVHEFVKKREPERQGVGVQSLLDSIGALIELQTRNKHVTLHVQLPPDLPPVLADRVMVEQVLLNLTRNAIEAMAQVAPERRTLRITASHDASSGMVEVRVEDQGHGIPDDVAERLFSPFFSTKAEGMGMGLNVCRTAIEFHGGTLTHRANPGGGTIFTFTLPAAATAAEAT